MPNAAPCARFKPMTGAVELASAEAAAATAARPARVTGVLDALFADLDGEAVTPDGLWRLASGARERLLQRAAAAFRPETDWLTVRCPACSAPCDLPVRLADAPSKPAGPGFPAVRVQTSLGARGFEAPNGLHERAVARLALSGDAARRQLIALCGLDNDSREAAYRLSAADLDAIDQALEALSPDIATEMPVSCPDCRADSTATIDPLAYAFPKPETVLRDVHRIARVYHWSEAEILGLPSARRQRYLALIGPRP